MATKAKAGSGQRRSKRFKLDLPLRVVVDREDRTAIVDGRGTDISDWGLAVFAGAELNPGDSIYVELTPSQSGLRLRVAGVVRNRSGRNYGVEFNPDTANQRQLALSLEELLLYV